MSGDLNNFGAISIDQVADVPGFKVPPSGAYSNVEASAEIKLVKGKPAFFVNFKLTEDGEGFLRGDQFGVMFNSQGLEYAKSSGVLQAIFTGFGATNLQGCVDAGTISANITIKRTEDKEDDTVHYARLVKFVAAA